ncbi:hypothetical protein [Paenibacillus donghaensis]|uniref:Spore coat protein n=1 Tax=Paenibacillus donghaensis TaxID=414771 RepID=A0A2Z2KGJ4_9BACL|nr:hypothetical protein [Paenibacillus donghaensis]ASA24967.1 hypothetical protein B9T62_31960 [Paenibacillus donghaensis]
MNLFKRALGVCLIVVLASTLSILTTGVVVNAYIQSVLASFDIQLDTPAPGFSGMIRTLTGAGARNTVGSDKSSNKAESGSPKPGTGTNSNQPSGSTDEPVEETVPENSLPVMGEISTGGDEAAEQDGDPADQQLVMTPEALGDWKDQLPSVEKVNIFNILMSKLPQDEMLKISTAMEDGLTENEVKELQQVIAKYVEPDEYDALMKMLTTSSEP